MTKDTQSLIELIKTRRSVFPRMYNGKPIEKAVLMDILKCANMAPTHRLTEPWRFKIFSNKGLETLGDFMGAFYKKHKTGDAFSEAKYQKILNKPRKSAYVVAIIMNRDEQERVPEVEEVCAVSCAVQNMWLACTAYGIGAYWSSGGPTFHEEGAEFLALKENEKCLGYFYMGYYEPVELSSPRGAIEDKITWIDS